jgi:cation diffusion facilitator family transporter
VKISSKTVVVVSFLVDLLDVILSLVVAILSGSVIMLSQVLEGFADLLASGLLIIGIARSKQKEDRDHPFGYGRELYFWSLLAGIVMLTITATLSIFFGWQRFLHPEPVHDINLALLVLGITLVTNSFAFYLSLKRLLRNRSFGQVIRIFLKSSLVETKTTFTLDLMGATASLLGIVALVVYLISGDQRFDGLGAIVIGLMLAVFAVILLIGTVDLIVGRSASIEMEDRIKTVALKIPQVSKVLGLKTLHIGSERLLVNLDVHLQHGLTTDQIEKLVDKIKQSIKTEIPQVKHIQVELNTLLDEVNNL